MQLRSRWATTHEQGNNFGIDAFGTDEMRMGPYPAPLGCAGDRSPNHHPKAAHVRGLEQIEGIALVIA